jgi:hypothetical protein
MSMEAVHDPDQSSTSWVARLVEVLQPLSLRADRLGAWRPWSPPTPAR